MKRKKTSKDFLLDYVKENQLLLGLILVLLILMIGIGIFQSSYAVLNYNISVSEGDVYANGEVASDVITVKDSNNNPVSGATINITCSNFGCGGSVSEAGKGRVDSLTLTTDSSGKVVLYYLVSSGSSEDTQITITHNGDTYGPVSLSDIASGGGSGDPTPTNPSGTSGNCTWEISSSGKLTIKPSSGSSCTLQNQSGDSNSPWYSNRTDITSVEVKPGVKANAGSVRLFNDLRNATSIDVTNLDTSNVRFMDSMFANCSSLTNLDLSSFNTSNVESMGSMFANCRSLTSLDLSNFNTDNVTNMEAMFQGVGDEVKKGTAIKLNPAYSSKIFVSGELPYGQYCISEAGEICDHPAFTIGSAFWARDELGYILPAYNVTYNANGGKINIDDTTRAYRIGSKINTSGISAIKNGVGFEKWNNLADGTGSISITKNGTSSNSYGDYYASVGPNGMLTMYAQYPASASEVKKDVVFIKIDKKTKAKLPGAVFRLYGTSKNNNIVDMNATSDANGKVEFKNVPEGTYKLKETKSPAGYRDNSKETTIKVGE